MLSEKPSNYYEQLGLPGIFVEEASIHDHYSKLQKEKKASDNEPETHRKFEAATEAYRCLKDAKCRNDYTRFGQSVSMSNDIEGFIEYDWRIGFSPCFFVIFAFIHGALGSVE